MLKMKICYFLLMRVLPGFIRGGRMVLQTIAGQALGRDPIKRAIWLESLVHRRFKIKQGE
jgi:hypothetical protein